MNIWENKRLRAPFAIIDMDVAAPLTPVRMKSEDKGVYAILRYGDRPVGHLWLARYDFGGSIPVSVLEPLVTKFAGATVDKLKLQLALEASQGPAPTPAMTVVVCTRNRADLLRRCLASLVKMRDERTHLGPMIDLLVVDNAPPDDATREAASEFPSVRYVVEPLPGLDFARNRAAASTDRPWLAYIDDDAVVDRFWLDRVSEEIARVPDAGCFTGPVAPLRLDTEAQLRFERAGGFGKGFFWRRHSKTRLGDAIYPAGAGAFGTGACMIYSTDVLRKITLFDEALDTGPPLPGGGDIDMFYRIVRAGYPLVYAGGILVHHEHRRDMQGLRKQYGSWGLGVMTLMRKNEKTDPEMRAQHRALLRWYAASKLKELVSAFLGRGSKLPSFVWAEMTGAVQGYFGEYERSQKRIADRKRKAVG